MGKMIVGDFLGRKQAYKVSEWSTLIGRDLDTVLWLDEIISSAIENRLKAPKPPYCLYGVESWYVSNRFWTSDLGWTHSADVPKP